MPIIRFLCLSILFVLPITARASLITHSGFTLNTDTNIVAGAGLEWLQWDETIGQSVNSALAINAADGWRVATNADMAALFNTFFPASVFGTVWDDDKATDQIILTPWTVDEDSVQNAFIELFGPTGLNSNIGTSADLFVFSTAFLGDGDGTVNNAIIRDDATRASDGVEAEGVVHLGPNAFASPNAPGFTQDSTHPRIGVALVRDQAIQGISIPEPTALFLISVGFLALKRRANGRLTGLTLATPG